MGQTEIIQVLKKTKKWMTSKQIRKHLNCTDAIVRNNCTRLAKFGFIKRKEIRIKGYWCYTYKL